LDFEFGISEFLFRLFDLELRIWDFGFRILNFLFWDLQIGNGLLVEADNEYSTA